MKYKKDDLVKIIGTSKTISEVLKKLNLNPKGGGKYLRTIVREILIENEVYNGHAHNKGKSYTKIKDEDFFIKGDKKRNYWNIRQALFKRGIKEKKCENCGLDKWMGKEIPVEIHHKDGDKMNNDISNLEVLCPNCHYFTDTYKTKNVNRIPNKVNVKTKKIKQCKCGKEILKDSEMCKSCYHINTRIVERPTLDILLKEIEELGYVQTGEKYGVSDNSIRKWIKFYNKITRSETQ